MRLTGPWPVSWVSLASDEPASLVVKLEPDNRASREKIEQWRGFEREIRFYNEIAKEAPFRVPRYYFGAFDAHKAVIVLEDLADLTGRDQVHGLRDRETLAAVGQIARLHAKFWDSPSLGDFDWKPVNEDRLTAVEPEAWASKSRSKLVKSTWTMLTVA